MLLPPNDAPGFGFLQHAEWNTALNLQLTLCAIYSDSNDARCIVKLIVPPGIEKLFILIHTFSILNTDNP